MNEPLITPDTWSWADSYHPAPEEKRTDRLQRERDEQYHRRMTAEVELHRVTRALDDLREQCINLTEQLQIERAAAPREGATLKQHKEQKGISDIDVLRQQGWQKTPCGGWLEREGDGVWLRTIEMEWLWEAPARNLAGIWVKVVEASNGTPSVKGSMYRMPLAPVTSFSSNLKDLQNELDKVRAYGRKQGQALCERDTEIWRLLKERDELLGSLKWAVSILQGDSGTGHTGWEGYTRYQEALTAIAKAEERES